MESTPSPTRHHTEDAAWSISAGTRQGAQAADTCMAADGWPYAAPSPHAAPRTRSSTTPPRTPAR